MWHFRIKVDKTSILYKIFSQILNVLQFVFKKYRNSSLIFLYNCLKRNLFFIKLHFLLHTCFLTILFIQQSTQTRMRPSIVFFLSKTVVLRCSTNLFTKHLTRALVSTSMTVNWPTDFCVEGNIAITQLSYTLSIVIHTHTSQQQSRQCLIEFVLMCNWRFVTHTHNLKRAVSLSSVFPVRVQYVE